MLTFFVLQVCYVSIRNLLVFCTFKTIACSTQLEKQPADQAGCSFIYGSVIYGSVDYRPRKTWHKVRTDRLNLNVLPRPWCRYVLIVADVDGTMIGTAMIAPE